MGAGKFWREWRWVGRMDGVQFPRHSRRATLTKLGGQGIGIELTAGELQLLRQVLAGFENVVRN